MKQALIRDKRYEQLFSRLCPDEDKTSNARADEKLCDELKQALILFFLTVGRH